MTATDDKTLFEERIQYWLARLDVSASSISFDCMKDKWASCSTDGNLKFNVELTNQDIEIIDYVIVHELLHLSVPNHGKLWKSLMLAHLGDYSKVEKRLRSLYDDQNSKPCQVNEGVYEIAAFTAASGSSK